MASDPLSCHPPALASSVIGGRCGPVSTLRSGGDRPGLLTGASCQRMPLEVAVGLSDAVASCHVLGRTRPDPRQPRIHLGTGQPPTAATSSPATLNAFSISGWQLIVRPTPRQCGPRGLGAAPSPHATTAPPVSTRDVGIRP